MIPARTGGLSAIQIKKDAAVVIIFVYSLKNRHHDDWDGNINLQWCNQRLPAQHTNAHIMAYGHEDLNTQAFAIAAVNKAASNLLSELDECKSDKRSLSDGDLTENAITSVLDPALPVLFICRGYAGLVVKKALILARSHSSPHSISQRVAGIIFLGTPHNDDVRSWADRMQTTSDVKHRNSPNRRTPQTLEIAEDFVDLTREFQQLSFLYMIVHFCDEDWLDCSGVTVLHSDCLWSMVSQSHLQRTTKENHYSFPRGTAAVISMTYVERAAVGMREGPFVSFHRLSSQRCQRSANSVFVLVAASRKSYRRCLEGEWAAKSLNARERLPSTCDWVFARNEYLEWTVADGPAFLWISGVAGAGKTILSSVIVDDLLLSQQQRDVIACCFLEKGFGRDDFARTILEVLFRQLLNHHAVPNHMLHTLLPQIEAVDSPMSREAFQRSLRSLLGNIDCQTRIVLVLDGLNEEDWIKCVVIEELIRVNNTRNKPDFMRCLISCRETCDYSAYRGHLKNISLDNEDHVHGDVLRFAESRLAETVPTAVNTNSQLTSIGKMICKQGRGNFLWVALVIESLQCADSVAEVTTKVQSLPPTVDGLYQRALQNIPSQLIDPVQRTFAWLLAAHRPLGLPELVEALTIEHDPHRPFGIRSTQCLEAELPLMCSPLIVTTRENTLKFRHSSVREYLLSNGETGIWGTSMVEAHTLLAQTCLMLGTPEEHEDSPFCRLPRPSSRSLEAGYTSSMKEYASTNWSFHYGLAESHSKKLVGLLHRSLTLTLHHDCEELSLPELGRHDQIETTILRIAAYHGYTSLTQMSLEMGVDRKGLCDCCETPLALAAARGHSEVAALLLRRGACTTASGSSRGETALHLAAAYGSQATVNILLKYNAIADSDAGCLSRTPLHAAASSGNLETIKILMNHSVDLNAMIPISGETPLHLAASCGHLQTVKWLLEGLSASDEEMNLYHWIVQQRYYQAWTEDLLMDSTSTRRLLWETGDTCFAHESMSELQSLCGKYADINICTRDGRTALHLAASNGHVSTVRFLVQKGANINQADNNRYTALRLAAENGHLNTVELLLTVGAALREDFHELGATLKSITKNGHDNIANLLTWHFFTMEVMGKACQWPMLALATKSKRNTVRDAIRKSYPHNRSMTLKNRTRAQSPDPEM